MAPLTVDQLQELCQPVSWPRVKHDLMLDLADVRRDPLRRALEQAASGAVFGVAAVWLGNRDRIEPRLQVVESFDARLDRKWPAFVNCGMFEER